MQEVIALNWSMSINFAPHDQFAIEKVNLHLLMVPALTSRNNGQSQRWHELEQDTKHRQKRG
jgi:hypothetical protein